MLAAGEELTDPIGYSSLWGWLAGGAVLLLVLWYVGVAIWAHRTSGPKPMTGQRLMTARERHLAELHRIGQQVHAGSLPERVAYQEMSATVRSFVTEASGLPARTMSLADLRAAGVAPLADAVELMYPPEFAPTAEPTEPLDATLARAQELVARWN